MFEEQVFNIFDIEVGLQICPEYSKNGINSERYIVDSRNQPWNQKFHNILYLS